ncbi:MAG: HPr family phosphocarrier protein [Lachnospiraceae bacterium]|nr:HPr family phosphocarrier protein [Lachnospiraceae bacterium]
MVSKKVIVVNKQGIHARPAGELAKICKNCKSETVLLVGERVINPKSVLNIMAAAMRCGTEITVQCDGENEKEELEMLVKAIESGLGE